MTHDQHPYQKRFEEIVDKMIALQKKKGQDYGTEDNPFFNICASESWGIPAWQGALLRAGDKLNRLQSYCRNGFLANEGVEDTLIDLANYAVIALVLWEHRQVPG